LRLPEAESGRSKQPLRRILAAVNAFFEELGSRFAEAAAERGVTIDAPALDATMADELLDLARVAAHTQERRFAPLASYLAGVAAERLRAATGATSGELAAYIRSVRSELEPEPAA
jgi:hypothetical protein